MLGLKCIEFSGQAPTEAHRPASTGPKRTTTGQKKTTVGQEKTTVGQKKSTAGQKRTTMGQKKTTIGQKPTTVQPKRRTGGRKKDAWWIIGLYLLFTALLTAIIYAGAYIDLVPMRERRRRQLALMLTERRPPGPEPWQLELGRRLAAEQEERLKLLREERAKSARENSARGDQDPRDPAAATPGAPMGDREVRDPVPAPATPESARSDSEL